LLPTCICCPAGFRRLASQFRAIVFDLEIVVAAAIDACYTLSIGTFPAILISFKLFLFDEKEKKVIWQV